MQAGIIISLFATALVGRALADEVTCWAPNGRTRANNETYVPCNKLGIEQSGVFSSCCQLDGDPDERDLCTSNGLCIRKNVVSRGYCTDRTWESPACVNVCGTDDENGNSNGTVELSNCGDGTYCCGHDNLECCGTDRAIKIPTQASVVTTSNVTETAFVTATVTPGTYKNATIGLAVVVGVMALAAIGAIVWLLRQNKTLRNQLDQKVHTETTPSTQVAQPYNDAYLPVSTQSPTVATSTSPRISEFSHKPAPLTEIHGQSRYSELDANNGRPIVSPSPRQAEFSHSRTGSPLPSPGLYQS